MPAQHRREAGKRWRNAARSARCYKPYSKRSLAHFGRARGRIFQTKHLSGRAKGWRSAGAAMARWEHRRRRTGVTRSIRPPYMRHNTQKGCKSQQKNNVTTLHRRAHHPTPEGRGCIGCVVALKGVLLGCSGARQGGGPGECHTSPRSSPWQRCTSRGPWAAPPACGPARDGAWLPVLCCRRLWPPDRRTTAAAAAGCRTSCECPSCLGVGASVLGARDVLPVAAAQGNRSRATRARWSELGRKVSPEDVFVYVARAYWPSLFPRIRGGT